MIEAIGAAGGNLLEKDRANTRFPQNRRCKGIGMEQKRKRSVGFFSPQGVF